MANKFNLGDTVQLKSGGPAMTVAGVPNDESLSDKYNCSWFRGATRERALFVEEELQVYVPPKKA
jgi:uncharacterized protein YodC (DUF2158 family)